MAFEGFGKNSGPSLPPKTSNFFGDFPPSFNFPAAAGSRPQLPAQPLPPQIIAQQQQPPPQRSEPQSFMQFKNEISEAPKRMQSPPPAFERDRSADVLNFPCAEAQRSEPQKGVQFEIGVLEAPKRMQSPPLAFERIRSADVLNFSRKESQRSESSPPRLGGHRKPPVIIHQVSSPAAHTNDAGSLSSQLPVKFNAPKRTRSPPLASAGEDPNGISYSSEVDTEREIQAKAKRLARFHVELSQPVQSPHDFLRQKTSGSKHSQTSVEKRKSPVDESSKRAGDSLDGSIIMPDYEGSESYPAICGLCPDMCPESEREERERKGDLDSYERLDGERNQTTKSLSVKKYNRTAERDAELIRPLPILRKTVDYLLNLLNQPYDDRLLGMYNFLWDRMRAIRMDLRMQHIFNKEAIIMLEKMIRLHIIAMHELCEDKKGEGFSEGFDAHLNIEQMNKTSVELFQMYDDHRKKGISVQTEQEFRGYYALFKLDKHPGYRVEPAELSLDLAKMSPEMRCTPEILFARDVARACRTGNFIAFFRFARKATYLQACLIHAHFAKLRTQALASLHSGLQNNQGIPLSHVVKWLGMEGEDIVSLLEYHGFSTKNFEEMYMVKEGPFLNSDVDYPTKCSQLVHLKRSKRIISDISCSQTIVSHSKVTNYVLGMPEKSDQRTIDIPVVEACAKTADEEMLDFEVVRAPKIVTQPQPMYQGLLPTIPKSLDEVQMVEVHPNGVTDVSVDDSLACQTLPSDYNQLFESGGESCTSGMPPSNVSESFIQVDAPGKTSSLWTMENLVPQQVISTHVEEKQLVLMLHEDDEAARARLKLILRAWKRRSSKKREIREQRQSLANAALSSLSMGPPVRQNEVQPSHASGKLDIDNVVRERDDIHEKSWSRLNVSEVVAPILSTRNSHAKCLCWKLVICLKMNAAGSKNNQLASLWLLSKLLGTGRENDDELLVSSSSLSIWKKLADTNVSFPQWCCYSVIRVVALDDNRPVASDDVMVGASAVMFLVSESISWEIQRVWLRNLLLSIPSGSSLPLLILSCGAFEEGIPDPSLMISQRLGLQDLDKEIISNNSIVFLGGNWPLKQTSSFFSDDHLKGGLQWLAKMSPLQPSLCQVRIHDLVSRYLGSSLSALDNMELSAVSPDRCISAFNEALDKSAEEIRAVADMNKNCWPGPEIDLLEESVCDHGIVNMLPRTGWSSPRRIELIIRAIESYKLPNFPYDLYWLNQGSDMGREIPSKKLVLEDFLASYLIQSTRLMSGDLAAKEASAMLQKGASLELRGSCYYIVPRWVMIFRRIYNWCLPSLSGGELTVAYVQERGVSAESKPCHSMEMTTLSKSGMESKDLGDDYQHLHLHSALTQLSLDEMIEISCSFPSIRTPGGESSVSEPAEAPEGTVGTDGDVLEIVGSKMSCEDLRFGLPSESHGISLPVVQGKQGSDKLEVLLAQCNKLQNMIDEKLAIYY